MGGNGGGRVPHLEGAWGAALTMEEFEKRREKKKEKKKQNQKVLQPCHVYIY